MKKISEENVTGPAVAGTATPEQDPTTPLAKPLGEILRRKMPVPVQKKKKKK